MENNLDIIGENCSRLSEQLKRLTKVKKPEELLSIQKECFNENIKATVNNFQKLVRIGTENMEELTRMWGTLREPVVTAAQHAATKAKQFTGKKRK